MSTLLRGVPRVSGESSSTALAGSSFVSSFFDDCIGQPEAGICVNRATVGGIRLSKYIGGTGGKTPVTLIVIPPWNRTPT